MSSSRASRSSIKSQDSQDVADGDEAEVKKAGKPADGTQREQTRDSAGRAPKQVAPHHPCHERGSQAIYLPCPHVVDLSGETFPSGWLLTETESLRFLVAARGGQSIAAAGSAELYNLQGDGRSSRDIDTRIVIPYRSY